MGSIAVFKLSYNHPRKFDTCSVTMQYMGSIAVFKVSSEVIEFFI